MTPSPLKIESPDTPGRFTQPSPGLLLACPLMVVQLIVAAAENDVIGRCGDLPWRLPADLRRFATLTLGGTVVMGRGTHESIVSRLGRPLPGRHSIVISQNLHHEDGITVVRTPEDAVALAGPNDWFVIGGASVYAALLPVVDVVELTRIHAHVDGDVQMPPGWLDGFTITGRQQGSYEPTELPFSFVRLERV